VILRRYSKTQLVVAGLIAIVIGLGASSAKAAPSLSAPQPVTIQFASNYAPPIFYSWGQKLTYRFTLVSHSTQTVYATVTLSTLELSTRGAPWSLYTLHYKLQPGENLNMRYDVVAPPEPVNDGDMLRFNVDASAQAQGYMPTDVEATSFNSDAPGK
jgi:hypothetical protein